MWAHFHGRLHHKLLTVVLFVLLAFALIGRLEEAGYQIAGSKCVKKFSNVNGESSHVVVHSIYDTQESVQGLFKFKMLLS